MPKKSLILKQKKSPKFKVRKYYRCELCGRDGGFIRKYGICRICFRELALSGNIPGVTKASF